jgi:hypothetical protein
MNTGKDCNSTTNVVKDKKCYLLVEAHSILNSWKNDMPATYHIDAAEYSSHLDCCSMWLSKQILTFHKFLDAGTTVF